MPQVGQLWPGLAVPTPTPRGLHPSRFPVQSHTQPAGEEAGSSQRVGAAAYSTAQHSTSTTPTTTSNAGRVPPDDSCQVLHRHPTLAPHPRNGVASCRRPPTPSPSPWPPQAAAGPKAVRRKASPQAQMRSDARRRGRLHRCWRRAAAVNGLRLWRLLADDRQLPLPNLLLAEGTHTRTQGVGGCWPNGFAAPACAPACSCPPTSLPSPPLHFPPPPLPCPPRGAPPARLTLGRR